MLRVPHPVHTGVLQFAFLRVNNRKPRFTVDFRPRGRIALSHLYLWIASVNYFVVPLKFFWIFGYTVIENVTKLTTVYMHVFVQFHHSVHVVVILYTTRFGLPLSHENKKGVEKLRLP